MGFVKARKESGVSFLSSVLGRSPFENLKYFLGLCFYSNRTPSNRSEVTGSFSLLTKPMAGHVQKEGKWAVIINILIMAHLSATAYKQKTKWANAQLT